MGADIIVLDAMRRNRASLRTYCLVKASPENRSGEVRTSKGIPMAAAASAPMLKVVPAVAKPTQASVAETIRRLQSEARQLAREQVGVLEAKLEEAAALALEIAEGGDAYPVGARELARKLAEDAPRTAQTLQAILYRA